MPVIAPFVQTPAITPTAPNLMPVNVIGNMPPKDSKGDWVLSAIKIGGGILLCFAAYKIYKNHTEKNKSI
jgi:hypothetical protein